MAEEKTVEYVDQNSDTAYSLAGFTVSDKVAEQMISTGLVALGRTVTTAV